jgi:hypothetical protein
MARDEKPPVPIGPSSAEMRRERCKALAANPRNGTMEKPGSSGCLAWLGVSVEVEGAVMGCVVHDNNLQVIS